MGGVTIREARDRADYDACVGLQRAVWGLADLEITSAVQLIATVHAGGLLLLAESDPAGVVGFCYAFAGLGEDGPCLHSDLLAVRADARGQGIGLRLKWAQREAARRRGLRLVQWTFDPMRAGNARLNLHHLGATARVYRRDFYGTTSSPLHLGLPTDRLLARWELDAPRVRQRAGEVGPDGGAQDPKEAAGVDEHRIEIPADWDAAVATSPPAALETQRRVREAFERDFADGFEAVDFDSGPGRPPAYVLRRRRVR
jgi:predicted GNAT superfamily acetyltransferase